MFSTGWYKFFNNREDAIAGFNSSFVEGGTIRSGAVTGIQTGCFGSYGIAHNHNPTGEFYFSLAAKTSNVEQAIAYFNKKFHNIQIEILANTKQYSTYETYSGYVVYTEKGWNSLTEEERARKSGKAHFVEYVQYLFRIRFSEAYHRLPAYALQIPLGFWVRMFCAYYGCLDKTNSPCKKNPIHSALVYSNNRPGENAGLISDYIVKDEVFLAMDDPERMNRYFDKPGRIQYLRTGNWSNLEFNQSVKPYSIYYVIEHDGDRGNTTNPF